MKELISIRTVEDKTSQNGKQYTRLNNEYNIFEAIVADQMKANVGKTFEYDVHVKGNYKNIRDLGVEKGIQVQPQSPPQPITAPVPMDNQFPKVSVVKEEILPSESLIKKDRPNSRTFGKGHDQLKVYFNDADDLERQLLELRDRKLLPEDFPLFPELKKSVEEQIKAGYSQGTI